VSKNRLESMDSQIKKLLIQQTRATPVQLTQIIQHIAAAPFSKDALEVDEPLWGGFWQGDVIAPGYRLPAVELALLRAIRLDGHWPEESTVSQFLAHLHQAILNPQAGVWTLIVAGEPGVVLAAPPITQRSRGVYTDTLTVVWYCATTGQLHAGYRTPVGRLKLAGAIEQRKLKSQVKNKSVMRETLNWIASTPAQHNLEETSSLAVRLDREILGFRRSP